MVVIDELDKVESGKDLSALLSWMWGGRMAVAKHRHHRVVTGKGWVFAACNTTKGLPKELLSRFLPLNIPPYTDEELHGVIVKTLTEREGTDGELAEYIAEKVMRDLGSRDPRDAIKIARLCGGRDDVDELASVMRKYRSVAGSEPAFG